MKRVQFIELEDLPWVPAIVRDGGTDLLDLLFAQVGFYRGLVDRLRGLIAATGERRLVDLCSGGGGGAIAMRALLRDDERASLSWTLTDRYPNDAAIARVAALGDPGVTYHRAPNDALAPSAELRGIRTMYGALHHFDPAMVRRLLQRAVDDRAPLAFFDVAASPALRRVPLPLAPLFGVVNAVFLVPLTLLLTPFVRPLRASRLALTYLLPAIPILFAWDGTVSAMRAYTPEELLEIARSVRGADTYEWEATRSGAALSLIGRPKAEAA
ncbi:MAG: hypothetical protein R3B09_02725 [Nannocystaceae bacterium]